MSHGAAISATHPMEGMKVYNLKLGMWVFLLSEVMFFSSLIGAYIILRFAHPEQWAEPNVVLNVPLTGFNTFMLICSSVTMVKAFAAIEHGDQAGLRKWLIATIILGSAFVSIQVFEYIKLAHEGFVPVAARYAAEGGPLYGSTFYTMTGFHGAHVTIGVLALIFTTIKAFRGKYSATDYGGVEIMGLYWHFVDLVWIILFTIVYLI
ncbi:MAG TPA: cytochrome c oxidase subunit 3 [Gemmatimonadota bacterium]|jgi:heme/copper-type cytochrome/quinol oxidase subunit 3|nr:cytochrome c oxidase subunit 3 [Gemmatimonadota bacterium]